MSLWLRGLRQPQGNLIPVQESAEGEVRRRQFLPKARTVPLDKRGKWRGKEDLDLMDDEQRQTSSLGGAFPASAGVKPRVSAGMADSSVSAQKTEGPMFPRKLMEEIVHAENVKRALERVEINRGSPGIDEMKVSDLRKYLKKHWVTIRGQLLAGTYKPMPVRRVEIPKPDGGGVRRLGIPTVSDRFIQQSVVQVLQRGWDKTFSEHSYGFRPKRPAHQAGRRRDMCAKATTLSWILIWRNFSIGSTMTN